MAQQLPAITTPQAPSLGTMQSSEQPAGVEQAAGFRNVLQVAMGEQSHDGKGKEVTSPGKTTKGESSGKKKDAKSIREGDVVIPDQVLLVQGVAIQAVDLASLLLQGVDGELPKGENSESTGVAVLSSSDNSTSQQTSAASRAEVKTGTPFAMSLVDMVSTLVEGKVSTDTVMREIQPRVDPQNQKAVPPAVETGITAKPDEQAKPQPRQVTTPAIQQGKPAIQQTTGFAIPDELYDAKLAALAEELPDAPPPPIRQDDGDSQVSKVSPRQSAVFTVKPAEFDVKSTQPQVGAGTETFQTQPAKSDVGPAKTAEASPALQAAAIKQTSDAPVPSIERNTSGIENTKQSVSVQPAAESQLSKNSSEQSSTPGKDNPDQQGPKKQSTPTISEIKSSIKPERFEPLAGARPQAHLSGSQFTAALSDEVKVVTNLAAPVPLPRELSRSVVDQVIKGLTITVSDNAQEMRVTLKPESLGEVVLKMKMDEGKLQAEINVAQPAVKAAIELQMADLRQALQDRGIDVQKIEVIASGQSANVADGQTPKDNRFRQKGGKRQGPLDSIDELQQARSLGYNTLEVIM